MAWFLNCMCYGEVRGENLGWSLPKSQPWCENYWAFDRQSGNVADVLTQDQVKLAELSGSSAGGVSLLYLARCRPSLVRTSQISPREGMKGWEWCQQRREEAARAHPSGRCQIRWMGASCILSPAGCKGDSTWLAIRYSLTWWLSFSHIKIALYIFFLCRESVGNLRIWLVALVVDKMLTSTLPTLKVSLAFSVLRWDCCTWEIQSRKATLLPPHHRSKPSSSLWKKSCALICLKTCTVLIQRGGKNLKAVSSQYRQTSCL